MVRDDMKVIDNLRACLPEELKSVADALWTIYVVATSVYQRPGARIENIFCSDTKSDMAMYEQYSKEYHAVLALLQDYLELYSGNGDRNK